MADEHSHLLTAAQQGDRAALDALIQLYYERVYRYGVRMCRDPVDAEDAVQEAFVALSRSVSGFRREASLSTWLFTVVKNACMRLLRPFAGQRSALGETPEAADVESPALTPEEALAREQVVRGVQEAVATLEPLYREVLVLRDIEGLSGPEVAERLGLSLEAMKSRLHRARLSVKERVEGLAPHEA